MTLKKNSVAFTRDQRLAELAHEITKAGSLNEFFSKMTTRTNSVGSLQRAQTRNRNSPRAGGAGA